jgi:hypothetical protein
MMNARSVLSGLKHQKEKRNMDYFAGLDVSVKETSVCIVDDTGKIVQETRVASEPEALLQVLTNTIYRFKRVGLEAGPLSQWLYSGSPFAILHVGKVPIVFSNSGFRCQALRDHPCRAHCSLRGRGLPSA